MASLAACGTAARLPVTAGMGPQPALPAPSKSMIPVVNVVTAKGWPATWATASGGSAARRRRSVRRRRARPRDR